MSAPDAPRGYCFLHRPKREMSQRLLAMCGAEQRGVCFAPGQCKEYQNPRHSDKQYPRVRADRFASDIQKRGGRPPTHRHTQAL